MVADSPGSTDRYKMEQSMSLYTVFGSDGDKDHVPVQLVPVS